MKKLRWLSFAVMGALACTMASCSDDEPGGGTKNEPGDGDGFYTSITLQLPTNGMGSRAEQYPSTVDPGEGNDPAQSKDGYEFGKDFENTVSSMTVVLATKVTENNVDKYNFVAKSNSAVLQVASNTQPTFVMQFDPTALKPYAADGGKKNTPLWIFAFCNPTVNLKTQLDKLTPGADISDLTTSINNANTPEIAVKNAFMMTNAETYDHTILEAWESLVTNHGTRNTAYNLTPIDKNASQISGSVDSDPLKVERTSCRFDFKSTTKTVNGKDLPANTYPIKDVTGLTSDIFAYVHIQQMALFNERIKFYAFRHSSPTDNPTASDYKVTLCGTETPSNYVISPDWSTLYNLTDEDVNYTDMYFLPLSDVAKATTTTTAWQSLDGLTEDDNHSSTQEKPWDTDKDGPNAGYKIWRYATENTLPLANQRHEVSTGVVFKAEIQSVENAAEGSLAQKISAAMAAGQKIYAYNEEGGKYENSANHTMIFGNANQMYDYCKSHASSNQRTSFVKAVLNGIFKIQITINGVTSDVKLPADYTPGNEPTNTQMANADAAIFPTGEGVTPTIGLGTNATNNSVLKTYNLMCYAPATDGKYYCYYYYYNRHNDNGKDKEMGPMEFATVRNNIYKLKVDEVMILGLPEDTPPDPWTPDENPKVYFKVKVKVLDWVVRKNNIHF